MKKIFFLSLFICFSTHLFSQDIIITIENDTIEAKVLVVYDAVVQYALFSDVGNATFLIPITKITMIKYQDGTMDSFDDVKKVGFSQICWEESCFAMLLMDGIVL